MSPTHGNPTGRPMGRSRSFVPPIDRHGPPMPDRWSTGGPWVARGTSREDGTSDKGTRGGTRNKGGNNNERREVTCVCFLWCVRDNNLKRSRS